MRELSVVSSLSYSGVSIMVFPYKEWLMIESHPAINASNDSVFIKIMFRNKLGTVGATIILD